LFLIFLFENAISDGKDILIGSVIEHIELAGTYSGDVSTVIPPSTLSEEVISMINNYTNKSLDSQFIEF